MLAPATPQDDSRASGGRFISVHGIDGVGKSTLALSLHDELERRGIPTVNYDEYGEKLDNPFRAGKKAVVENGTLDEQFSHFLGSTQFHADQIRSLMNEGFTVVKSRHLDDVIAHYAHLGFAEGAEIAGKTDITDSDFKIMLTTSEEERISRVLARGNPTKNDLEPKTPGSRHQVIEDIFKERISSLEGEGRGIIIDNTDKAPEEITKRVLRELDLVFPDLRGRGGEEIAFDSRRYVRTHTEAIRRRIADATGPIMMEIGGKPFGDHHASRVLTGYHPNA